MTACYEPEIIQSCATGVQLKESVNKLSGLLSTNFLKIIVDMYIVINL